MSDSSPGKSGLPLSPLRLHLDRTKQLEVTWGDGEMSVYPLEKLRADCPCASCKISREEALKAPTVKSRLRVLSGDFSKALVAVKADLVGNYAIRIEWSDEHLTGIYSFEYLYSIRPGV